MQNDMVALRKKPRKRAAENPVEPAIERKLIETHERGVLKTRTAPFKSMNPSVQNAGLLSCVAIFQNMTKFQRIPNQESSLSNTQASPMLPNADAGAICHPNSNF
jgi:hypothetical protein